MLWHSGATIAAILHEIVSIYGMVYPPTLNAVESNRVCNSLALLQCVASHPETRSAFLAVSLVWAALALPAVSPSKNLLLFPLEKSSNHHGLPEVSWQLTKCCCFLSYHFQFIFCTGNDIKAYSHEPQITSYCENKY